MWETVEYFNRTQAFMISFKYRVRKYLNQLHISQASQMHWLFKLTFPLEKVFVDENFGGIVEISVNKSRVTLYTAGHLHTAVPHCSHSRASIVHTAVPRENNEHGCVYLRCRAVCKLPGCVEGHPWMLFVKPEPISRFIPLKTWDGRQVVLGLWGFPHP